MNEELVLDFTGTEHTRKLSGRRICLRVDDADRAAAVVRVAMNETLEEVALLVESLASDMDQGDASWLATEIRKLKVV